MVIVFCIDSCGEKKNPFRYLYAIIVLCYNTTVSKFKGIYFITKLYLAQKFTSWQKEKYPFIKNHEYLYQESYTVDVYRYKTLESIGNSFVTFPKGISYRFYQYYL